MNSLLKWISKIICTMLLIGSSHLTFSQSQVTTTDSIQITPFIDSAKLVSFVDQYANEHIEALYIPGLVVVIVEGDKSMLSKG